MEEVKFLILTILIELPVALVLLRGADWRRVVLLVMSVNLISHPIAWQLIINFGFSWLAVETGVAVFEGGVLALMLAKNRDRGFLTGIVMNVVTAAIGFMLF